MSDMKAIILARVSTEEQREAGNSLPAQIERLKSYCVRKDLQIAETYSFDESAYKTKRDEFDKVLEYLAENAAEMYALCFDKVDRFSRNVFDKRVGQLARMAEEGKIELHFVSDNQIVDGSQSAASKFHFGMSLGAAKYYSDSISDNVKRAFEQKRRSGEWTGPVRIGYVNIMLDAEKRLRKDIVPDPNRAHLICALFELFATGNYSISTVWQKITEMGLQNRTGKKLSRSNVAYILNDPFYCGTAVSKKYGSYLHKYEKLISRTLFEKCQEVLRGRSKKPSKMESKNYVFQGMLPCSICECLYSPENHKGNNYYSCTNAKGMHEKREYVNEKVLLEPLKAVFESFAGIPQTVQNRIVSELRKSSEHEIAFHEKQIRRIRNEYDETQRMVEVLLDLRLRQSITLDEYDKKLQQLKDRQYHLNIELEEYTKADHQYHVHVSTVLNLCRRIGEIFESSETLEKRAILNYILQNPRVSGKTLQFSLKKPFDTVLELACFPVGLPG